MSVSSGTEGLEGTASGRVRLLILSDTAVRAEEHLERATRMLTANGRGDVVMSSGVIVIAEGKQRDMLWKAANHEAA